MDVQQLERARERLAREPDLAHRTYNAARTTYNEARKNHPRGWAALDGDMRTAMATITSLTGAEQLLAVESLKSTCDAWRAEAKAHVDRVNIENRAAKDAARLDIQRQAVHLDWAERTGSTFVLAASTFANALDSARRRVPGRKDDVEMLAILDELAEQSKEFSRAIAAEHRAAKERLSLKAAEAA